MSGMDRSREWFRGAGAPAEAAGPGESFRVAGAPARAAADERIRVAGADAKVRVEGVAADTPEGDEEAAAEADKARR